MMTKEEAVAFRGKIEAAATRLPDEEAVSSAELFPLWNAEGIPYAVGERARSGGLLYKCLTGHTSQESWTPDASPSLWVRIDDPAIEWPQWRRPSTAEDAYPKGAKVTHNGKRWISDLDANVWEPGVSGWTEQS